MSKTTKGVLIGIGIMAVLFLVFITVVPAGRALVRDWDAALEEVDEDSYENRKVVEDTCRAMISSYKSDKITYETYIDSADEEEQGWAKQAKIRANSTATQYNEYYLKNSFIWEDNVPSDIDTQLPILE